MKTKSGETSQMFASRVYRIMNDVELDCVDLDDVECQIDLTRIKKAVEVKTKQPQKLLSLVTSSLMKMWNWMMWN